MRRAGWLVCLTAVIGACLALPSAASAQQERSRFDVLVFSKTEGFRHDSIPAGVDRIRRLGRAHGFRVRATEDARTFRGGALGRFEVVVFLSTTGDVLNAAQQDALKQWVRDGGGFVGVHAAADTEYDWRFYGRLVGARFERHPAIQAATVEVTDRVHPSTKHLPERWTRTDEWYDYRASPRGDVHVLASLDEGTYEGGGMGADHPIAWCHELADGRSWYTGGGHTAASFRERAFRRHLLGGIRWAGRAEFGDCRATVDSSFQKVTLNDSPGEPMGLAVLPDGRVLHTDRTGEVRLHDPETGLNTIAADLTEQVYTHDEEGVQSIAIDPDFRRNRWVYLYHSLPTGDTPEDDPATEDENEGDAPTNGTRADFRPFEGAVRLSRFKFDRIRGTLDVGSAQRIIDVPVDRGLCCHVGGHIDFDARGNLYLSTGDDTNPFESDGYAPLDERARRNPGFDAQRSAANTNDLRGKVLRIKPRRNRPGYTIPAGNLFPRGAKRTRPEIYLMGLRNPFRIAVDRENGLLYVADYSPDADEADPDRGPAGQGKWFTARRPGNYGWPYCATAKLPYVDYDFGSEEPGERFNCRRPVNTSPNNTGRKRLPPVEQPDVWYSYGRTKRVPAFGEGGIAPMAGPAYDYRRRLDSRVKWPEFYDGVPLFYEWTRDRLNTMFLGGSGNVFAVGRLLPSFTFDGPMDMEFGPDGALYTLEYGEGYFLESPAAQLARIDYVRGGRTPVVKVAAEPASGDAPLAVAFSSEGTRDPDGDRFTYEWDLDGDGTFDSTEPSPAFTYARDGVYQATLKVTDRSGRAASASEEIVVGNDTPAVTFVTPQAGQPFRFGEAVRFEVQVTDDQAVDCTQVEVSYVLGHNEHGHPLSSTTGCTGRLRTSAQGHQGEANIRGVFVATYEDEGPTGNGAGSLSGSAEVILEPTGGD